MRRTLFRWNPNTQNKADTSSFTVEDVATQLISNVFVLFRLLSPCLKFSPHKSVQGWGSLGAIWAVDPRTVVQAPSQQSPPGRLPSTHKHMHEIWRSAEDVFPCWLTFVPPSKRRCYEFQVVGTSVWRTGHPLPGGVGEKKSPVLDPLLSKPSPTRVQLEKTKTLCRDVHRRQKGEKSNHIEEIFCTLCWFWGSVGKRRRPGRASSSAARREDTELEWCSKLLRVILVCVQRTLLKKLALVKNIGQ